MSESSSASTSVQGAALENPDSADSVPALSETNSMSSSADSAKGSLTDSAQAASFDASVSGNGESTVSANTVDTQDAAEAAPLDTSHFVIPTDQTVILDTVMGNMQYFNQMDSHWGSYLISGKDQMNTNGCGPTCVAMVIHAFGNSSEQVTPVTMADWAVANNQYVVGAGSEHTIVETALTSYGLTVTSLQSSVSAETIVSELQAGHLLIGLMGPGFFTDEGHYLLMTGLDSDGNICIADPHSSENTSRPFTADFLISQLRTDARDGGAPLWSISRQ